MKINQQDFLQLADIIKKSYGLNLFQKKYLVENRLTNYVLDCGFKDFSEYLQAVYRDKSGKEMANIINRLTTNYTYFMREVEHFQHFSKVFLKEAEKKSTNKELSIWSAGCSFGNEPYTIAMCLDNYFSFKQSFWDTKILATDISFNALKSAKYGVYTEQSLQNLPEKWNERYFYKLRNNTYQVKDEIRRNVVFKYHNLMEDINFKKKFDLIICRNVMIYFDDKTKEDLINKFYEATKDGGYLYIGHADLCPKNMPYKMIQPAVYQKITSDGGDLNG